MRERIALASSSVSGSPIACLKLNPTNLRTGAEIATAKAICATCPVSKQCLSAGLNEAWGIWGGLTPQERRLLPSPRRQLVA
jgi:hypothetical protein